jgi:hypothetical protein
MRRLPLAYQCDRRWAEMDGDGVVRRCHDCERDVVNLSALDEATARTLLAGQTETACVRYRHEGGRIVFARKVRELAVAAAAAVLLASVPAGADTTTPPPQPHHPTPASRRHKRGEDKKHEPPAPKKDDGSDGGVLLPNF